MSRLLTTIEAQVINGERSLIQLEFLHYLHSRFQSEDKEEGALICALYCIKKNEEGHICIYLNGLADDLDFFESFSGTPLSTNDLKEACKNSNFIGKPGDFTPLILSNDQIYLQKFWNYENELINWLLTKSGFEHSLSDEVLEYLEKLFGDDSKQNNYQYLATKLVFLKDFVVITGSPGTGKTYTIKKIVRALLDQNPDLNIAFAAPTGKAADRMNQSLVDFSEEFQIPRATTIHKLLAIGFRPGRTSYKKELLDIDVLIIDEASMLDLSLWIQMIRALPDSCKLIALGDKNQLASVEAGSILGDICFDNDNTFSSGLSNKIENKQVGNSTNKLNDSIIELTKSHRFEDSSGIAELAEAIKTENTGLVLDLLHSSEYPQLLMSEVNSEGLDLVLQDYGITHFDDFVKSGHLFEVLNKKKILCAFKQGPFGSDSINNLIETEIKSHYKIPAYQNWYEGRPILITRNNNLLKVYNGEVGYVSTDFKTKNQILNFENRPGLSFLISRLNDIESAFALTIHKSQGSEYDHVAIVLGNTENQLLSKQLLYTAVTRARKSVLVIGNQEIIKSTIEKSAVRRSGIRQKITF
ncbi:MAG: exodeoxyribonuclease V subunit alpha [Balneola sp.]|nr:MAG: exodeoxyribonuclease V subunit alpha [Balneola sp.]